MISQNYTKAPGAAAIVTVILACAIVHWGDDGGHKPDIMPFPALPQPYKGANQQYEMCVNGYEAIHCT